VRSPYDLLSEVGAAYLRSKADQGVRLRKETSVRLPPELQREGGGTFSPAGGGSATWQYRKDAKSPGRPGDCFEKQKSAETTYST